MEFTNEYNNDDNVFIMHKDDRDAALQKKRIETMAFINGQGMYHEDNNDSVFIVYKDGCDVTLETCKFWKFNSDMNAFEIYCADGRVFIVPMDSIRLISFPKKESLLLNDEKIDFSESENDNEDLRK